MSFPFIQSQAAAKDRHQSVNTCGKVRPVVTATGEFNGSVNNEQSDNKKNLSFVPKCFTLFKMINQHQ